MTLCGLKAKDSSPPNSSRIGKPSAKRCRASSRALVSADRLAATVERSIDHQDAERVLADLRKRRKVVRERIAASTHIGTTEEDRKVFQNLHTLERQISAAAHELVPLRQAHGRRVDVALRPEVQAAATAALAAIAEADAALGRLNALREQLRLVGGSAPSLSPKPLLMVKLMLEDVIRQARKGEAA